VTQPTALAGLLDATGITQLVVGGLATDYCVRATVLDALERHYPVRVLRAAVRAVDLKPGDGARALDEMAQAGAVLV
jgi:nicotinamidase/pyrazinamidase